MAGKSFYDLEIDLNAFAKTVDVALEKVVKKTAFDLFGKIVRKTPVDTGRARASWGMSQGHIPDKAHPEIKDKLGAQAATAIAQSNIEVDFSNPDGVIWIYNNLPYIEPLEHGHSGQAPIGMVRLSLAEMETNLMSDLSDVL